MGKKSKEKNDKVKYLKKKIVIVMKRKSPTP